MRYRSWGGWPRTPQHAVTIHWRDRADELLKAACNGGTVLPFGNGRSYGDVCLNTAGRLLDTRGLDRFIEFDEASGVLRCEAGVQLFDILRLVVPRGWFLPVTPGTQFVTVGGAIANDVHGKNHHRVGSFGCHLVRFELLRSNGSRLECSATSNADLFFATIGGLGLTGLITWAELRLRRVSSPDVLRETRVFRGVEEFLALSEESANSHEYTVAWIDCLATGRRFARGLFWRGNHAEAPLERNRQSRYNVPVTPPFSLARPITVRAFNELYYRAGSRSSGPKVEPYTSFFYPLDGLRNWNRMYGPNGFLQYQFVVPLPDAARFVSDVLKRIADSRSATMLAVLKVLGPKVSGGLISFPREGVTLAVDLQNPSPPMLALLDDLDDMVADAGGAVYPAKDARMSAGNFRRFFPAWPAFQAFVDPAFRSDFFDRVRNAAA